MRIRLASLLFPLLSLFALAVPAVAQDPRVFHADKDLEGYEQCSLSEFWDLYVFTEFKAADGKTLPAAEIETLRAHWKAEQERAGKRIAQIEADPRERWFWKFEKRIAQHTWFSKHAYTIERPEPGFAIVVQRPLKDDPGYAARLVAFYQPFVKKLAANFDAQIAQPAGLLRREGREGTAIAVLASGADFEQYADGVSDTTDHVTNSGYDAQQQLAFTWGEPPAPGPQATAQRAALLYQVAKELQHAHLLVDGNRPGSLWLYQGLAFLLSTHDGAAPEALDKHSLRPGSASLVAELLAKEDRREQLLLPLDELAGLRSFDEYREAVSRRSLRMNSDDPLPDEATQAWLAQCELWSNFLYDGAQGLQRKRYLAYIHAALSGKGDTQELCQAFAGADPRTISRDFLRSVCSEFERTHAGKKVDRAPIERLFLGVPAVAANAPVNAAGGAKPAAGATAAAGAAPGAAAPAFAAEALAPDADDWEAQLALRLLQAREGDLAGAAKELNELAARASAPWTARFTREAARMTELAHLREGYLAFLKTSGGKLTFKNKGKDVQAPVAGLDKELVQLGENKSGLAALPLGSVDPYEIAKLAAKKEQQGGAQPWARFYGYALAGDARWEKLLKDDSPVVHELREDAKSYPALAKTAQTARALAELSKLGLPHDAKEAGTCLERVRAFLTANAGTELLARRVDLLRELASAALAEQRRGKSPASMLRAKSTELGEGKIKLVWEFDDAKEAEDWIKVLGYMQQKRKAPPKEEGAAPDAPKEALGDANFSVTKGVWGGKGAGFFRMFAAFTGPIVVRYTFHFDEGEGETPTLYLGCAICDDGKQDLILASSAGEIRVEDPRNNDFRTKKPGGETEYDWGRDATAEVSNDTKDLVTRYEGKELARLSAGKRKSGWVGFLVQSDLPVAIERIEIEGKLDPSSFPDLERAWTARQLTLLGFP